MSDDARKVILARRARFLAAAMAVTGCGKETVPASPPDASPLLADPIAPKPCLELAPPQPCLEIQAPPPAVCLKIAPPPNRRDASPCDPADPLCAPKKGT